MDPAIVVLALAGFALLWRISRLRERPDRLLAALWALLTIAGISAFQVRNLPYLVLLLPPLVILGAGVLNPRPLIAGIALAVVAAMRVAGSGAAPPIKAAEDMRAYYNLNRDAELIAVEAGDEFYGATLPLPSLRYAFVDPAGAIPRTVPYYVPMGIVLTAWQFVELPSLLPQFRDALEKYDWKSTEPVGTVIGLSQLSDLSPIIRAYPGTDFYIPDSWKFAVDESSGSHEQTPASTGRVFLFSKSAKLRSDRPPSLPVRW